MSVKVREKAKGSGQWWIFVHHAGRRKAIKVGTLKAARLAADRIAGALASGDTSPLEPRAPVPASVTFRDYAERWLAGVPTLGVKPLTAERYESLTRRHLVPAFGSLNLEQLTRQRVRAQLAVWLGPTGKVRGSGALRRGSVRLILATLRLILNAAVEDGLLQANPALRLGRVLRPDPAALEERPDPFTAEETETLLATAERDMPEWHALFLTLARTGLRIGETLGLQWDDVATDRLMIRRAYTRGRIGSPKGNRGRLVDMSPQTAEALWARRAVLETDAALAGRDLAPWVFPTPDGQPTDDRWLRQRVWRPLLRRAGLRQRGLHQLRHSYASILLGRGVAPKYVQGQLGHASLAVTLSVYSHLLPGEYGRLADQLDTTEPATSRDPGATTSPPE